jgi:hypothetical protein
MKNFLTTLKDCLLFKQKEDFKDIICNISVWSGLLLLICDAIILILFIVQK